MFRSSVREFDYNTAQYKGGLHTFKEEVVETSTGSGRFVVRRPRGFHTRADIDIGGTFEITKSPVEYIAAPEMEYDRNQHIQILTPHLTDSDLESLPQFLNTKTCTGLSWETERGNEVYRTAPGLLLPLAEVVCPDQEWKRRSKVGIVDQIWSGPVEPVDDAEDAEHQWLFRDRPNGALQITVGETQMTPRIKSSSREPKPPF